MSANGSSASEVRRAVDMLHGINGRGEHQTGLEGDSRNGELSKANTSNAPTPGSTPSLPQHANNNMATPHQNPPTMESNHPSASRSSVSVNNGNALGGGCSSSPAALSNPMGNGLSNLGFNPHQQSGPTSSGMTMGDSSQMNTSGLDLRSLNGVYGIRDSPNENPATDSRHGNSKDSGSQMNSTTGAGAMDLVMPGGFDINELLKDASFWGDMS